MERNFATCRGFIYCIVFPDLCTFFINIYNIFINVIYRPIRCHFVKVMLFYECLILSRNASKPIRNGIDVRVKQICFGLLHLLYSLNV